MTQIWEGTMNKNNNRDTITRKEALKKMGKYAAFTAVGTFLILNPQRSQAQSPPDPGGNPFDEGTPDPGGDPFGG